jgi:hypothetical protein
MEAIVLRRFGNIRYRKGESVMPVFQSGPFNIEQGNSANFTVEFLDSNGFLSVPPSASMTVTYVNTSFAQQVDTVSLVVNNSFFTGTWSSVLSSLCLATWSATTSLSTALIATGQLRIIQRRGSS